MDWPHYFPSITQNQKLLSSKIVEGLTQLNIKRLESISQTKNQGYQFLKQNPQKYLFVCLHGLPVFKDSFDFLDLPKNTLYIFPAGFQLQKSTESEMIQKMKNSSMVLQSKQLFKKLNTPENAQKKIIFLYHSYGTYILTCYLEIYGKERVIGLIDIGGVPITAYSFLRFFMKQINLIPTIEFFIENLEVIYDSYKKQMENNLRNIQQRIKKGIINPKQVSVIGIIQNKYQFGCFFGSFIGQHKPNIFLFNRRWPKILKIIIFGRYDTVFQNQLLNEKAIYYTYVNPPDTRYEKHMVQIYKQKYNLKQSIKEIQPKFIYSLPGKHSVHMQKKFQIIIKKAIWEYLDFVGQNESK